MSDPDRTPSLLNYVAQRPPSIAVIYRHFGAADKLEVAQKLRHITFAKKQQLLIGHDPELAIKVGADGVHFKRDVGVTLPALWRKRCPDWLITMAGLKSGKYEGDVSVLDGLFLSSIFDSQSPSAGPAKGVKWLTEQTAHLNVPVYALGGLSKKTAPTLIGTGVSGVATVSGI